MKTISCIIPAYNEEKQIHNSLTAVTSLLGKSLYEIVVVDDCSVDNTRDIVKKFPQVKLIELEKNRGKSNAVARGIEASSGEYIALIDADLLGLTVENIQKLLLPILEDVADVTISIRGNSPWFTKKLGVDFMSGERVFARKIIEQYLHQMSMLPNFGIEVFLNQFFIDNRLRLVSVTWNNVGNYFKYKKRGFLKGLWMEVLMFKDVFAVIPVYKWISQQYELKQLLIKNK